MLHLESLRVVKSNFGIEVLRACQGNLWHFSIKVKFSHFCLCQEGRLRLSGNGTCPKSTTNQKLRYFLHCEHNAAVCTSSFLPFPLNDDNFLSVLFTGCLILRSHVSDRVEHLHFTLFNSL